MTIEHEFEEQHLRRQRKRDIKRNRDSRPFWKKLLVWTLSACLASMLCCLGIALYAFVSGDKAFELKEVAILGASRADVAGIQRVIHQEFPRNLYSVRLREVEEFLQAQPWVRSVQVIRVFPNKLKILVAERRPVALAKIENELFLVDRNGVVLEPHGAKFQRLDLPVVRGLENSTLGNVSASNRSKMETVMQLLNELDYGSGRLSEKISEIDVADPNRVAIVPVDQPVKVFLGDSGFRERFEIFLSRLSLMGELTAKYGVMDSVDLSVKNRIIFHTKSGSGSSITVKDEQTG